MKTNHSSLLADTGWSEIELDHMKLVPIARNYEALIPHDKRLNDNPTVIAWHTTTFPPFKGKEWYDDEDVQEMLKMEYFIQTGRKYNGKKIIPTVVHYR
jgi:hypothetical protein